MAGRKAQSEAWRRTREKCSQSSKPAASNTALPPTRSLEVSKLAGEPGDQVTFADVLMLGGDKPSIGVPHVAGASVVAEIVEHRRGPKIIVFKKRRRKNSRRKNGHRQDATLIRITEILTGRREAFGKGRECGEEAAREKGREGRAGFGSRRRIGESAQRVLRRSYDGT